MNPDDLLDQAAQTLVALDQRIHEAMTLGRPQDCGMWAEALADISAAFCNLAEAADHLRA